MINKVIISIIAAIQVLTLFPLLFFGIYTMVNSGNIAEKDLSTMFLTLTVAIVYASVVLFSAYKAIQNYTRPVRSYLFLCLPFLVIAMAYGLKSFQLI